MVLDRVLDGSGPTKRRVGRRVNQIPPREFEKFHGVGIAALAAFDGTDDPKGQWYIAEPDEDGNPRVALAERDRALLQELIDQGKSANELIFPGQLSAEGNLIIVGKTARTQFQTIPGLVAASAYTSGDALGTNFSIEVPTSGVIESATLLDFDKEALATDLILFDQDFASGTDNSPFDVAEIDLPKIVGAIQFGTFFSFSDNAVGVARGLGLAYVAPTGYLHVQAVTRDVPNLTARSDYRVSLTILSD